MLLYGTIPWALEPLTMQLIAAALELFFWDQTLSYSTSAQGYASYHLLLWQPLLVVSYQKVALS